MPDNRISASLSQADRQAVIDAINTIRAKLPFLVDLSPEERRSLPRMGDKSRGFVTLALEVATQNADILPRSFDVEDMRKDVELLEYFEATNRAYPGEHWRNGAEMCRWWLRLISSGATQSDVDEFVARLEAEKDYGSGWLDLGLRFRGWARSRGFVA